MNRTLKTSLVTLTLLVAACSTEVRDGELGEEETAEGTGEENLGTSEDALKKQTALGGIGGGDVAIGTAGTATALGWPSPFGVPRKAPRVLTRSASGSTVKLTLDRALAADELVLPSTEVIVVRKSGSTFVKKNLAAGTSLSADKKTVSIALSETVKAGEIYFPRGTWRPCATSTLGSKCKPRPARFGEIIVKSVKSSPLADGIVNVGGVLSTDGAVLNGGGGATAGTFNGTVASGQLFFAATQLAIAPAPQTVLELAEAPLPEQGSFRVKSVTPTNDSTDADRKTEKVIITFEGGTIDCAKTGRGQGAFHLRTVSPDVYEQQSMFEDPQNALPNTWGYRGHLRCEEDTNRIIFTTPGVLLGDSWFQIDLNAWSKENNFMGNKVLEFKTKRPGLQVLATRLENHYGGDNTCDNDVFGTNYCDIYVTTAIATAGGGQPSRIPEQGDFGGMKAFASDPISGTRDLWPNRVLYANANPVDEVVDVQMWAVDADDDSTWKKVFEVAGKVAGAMATALTPIKPEAGAVATGLSAGFLGLAEIIPTNEDDFLGSGRFIFTSDMQRWGTQATSPIVLDLSKNSPDRGPVKVFLRTEELPRSWRLQGPIL